MDGRFAISTTKCVWLSLPVGSTSQSKALTLHLPFSEDTSFLIGYGVFNPLTLMAGFIAVAAVANERENGKDEA